MLYKDRSLLYKDTLVNLFKKDVPLKNKYIHASEAPFMTEDPHKEIMKR